MCCFLCISRFVHKSCTGNAALSSANWRGGGGGGGKHLMSHCDSRLDLPDKMFPLFLPGCKGEINFL